MYDTLLVDAQPDTKPMTYYIDSPDDIDDRFDGISYNKGM